MVENKNAMQRFSPVGENALLVTFDDALTHEAHGRVRTLDERLKVAPLAGVIEWIPAFASLVVLFDPLQIQWNEVENWINDCLDSPTSLAHRRVNRVEILVHYGGEDGPDLAFVAGFHGLTPAQVIEKHAEPIYQVGMMGFMPGFAYLLGLDPALATPRLDTPRTHIPAGSVGIAGQQTGVYPLASPGGWQLIGRTDQGLFDPRREPYFRLAPGDEVRFVPAKRSRLG
ncbi:MAG: 5-oxoprolinase subunit PxpB [Brevefilum sp.]|nr:5-oxoprolinase subunit PxpB [Brevefilum sp.]